MSASLSDFGAGAHLAKGGLSVESIQDVMVLGQEFDAAKRATHRRRMQDEMAWAGFCPTATFSTVAAFDPYVRQPDPGPARSFKKRPCCKNSPELPGA
ncbi:MAG: hypothetical protein OXC26_00510 [Albidovulum sp.]|nr:hypothetical protein [Albidovulum sp.]